MKVFRLDHIVIPVSDPAAAMRFYVGLLGMTPDIDPDTDHWGVRFGPQKINLHHGPAQFLPAAKTPTVGSADLCLVVEGPLEAVRDELLSNGATLECGPVPRNGALGPMQSLYLRDPDGNLVELSVYEYSAPPF